MLKLTSKGLKKGSMELENLGRWLQNELDAAYSARAGLKERWDQTQKVLDNHPDMAGVRLYDNFEPRAIPVMSPRINRIINVTMANIVGANPMVQAIPDDLDLGRANDLEKGLQTTWELANFERIVRRAMMTAAVTGVSVVRMRLTLNGLKFDHIHPNDFVIGPTYGVGIKDAHLTGHRFYTTRWKIKDGVKSGYYDLVDGDEVDGWGSADPDFNSVRPDVSYDRSTNEESPERDNDLIELWEFIVRLNIDGEGKLCRVVYHADSECVLLKEPYVYSRPWYYDIRFHDEEGKWWPANSLCQHIKGICMLQSDMFNLLVGGSMATAVSPTIISGGFLGKKITSLGLGKIYQSPSDLKVQQVPLSFKSGEMPLAMKYIDDLIESQTGISDNRILTERKSGDVTATQIAAEEQAAQQNEGSYPAFVSDFIEEMAYGWQEYVQKHPGVFRAAYGKYLSEGFFASRNAKVRFQVTGRIPSNSPQFILGKLESVMAMASQPQSGLHYKRTEEEVVAQLGLPINIERLKKTDEEMAQEQAQAMAMAQMESQQGSGNSGVNGLMAPGS